MRKNDNIVKIQGRLFQHNLEKKKVESQGSKNYGKEYIAGTIDIATDEACLNVVQVRYSYVTAETKLGKQNVTYGNLQRIMEGGRTVVADGKDAAMMVQATSRTGVNEFYGRDGGLIAYPVVDGGFLSFVKTLPEDEKSRDIFIADTLIHKIEVDESGEKAELHGVIFNFNNDIFPFTFIMRDKSGIKYFEGLNISNASPAYVQIHGRIISSTIKIEEVIDSPFGEPAVDITEKKVKEWLVTGINGNVNYVFGDPDFMTMDDLKKGMENRNVRLTEIKKRAEERKNNTVTQVQAGEFSLF